MILHPDEKSNNPYANWVQPSDGTAFPPQQQTQYQAPLSPPPAYTQEPLYPQRDGTYQGFNPQSQVHQSQTYQPELPPRPQASHNQRDGKYPSQQQNVPEANYRYDQDRAGPSYPSHQQGVPGANYHEQNRAGPSYPSHQQDVPGANYHCDQNRAGPSYAPHQPINSPSPYSQTPGTWSTSQDRSPPPGDTGGGLSLASFFGNTGPPPMWQRQPAVHLPYSQFPPMCLISNSKDLGKGFPEVPPPCQIHPHPFSTHDITEEDWRRFLADVKKSGSLSGGQRIKSNVIPLVTGVGLIGGLFMTSGIEKKMKAKNRGAAGDVVDTWNHYFFGPRRMEAVLCQDSERLSGRDGAAPFGDPNQRHMANDLRRRTSSSSSDSDSSSSSDSDDNKNHHHGHGHGSLVSHKFDRRQRFAERREAKAERRQEKRAHKEQRRQEKRARKAERRARKSRGEHSEPYQIFIQPI